MKKVMRGAVLAEKEGLAREERSVIRVFFPVAQCRVLPSCRPPRAGGEINPRPIHSPSGLPPSNRRGGSLEGDSPKFAQSQPSSFLYEISTYHLD